MEDKAMVTFITSVPGIISILGSIYLVARRFGFSPIVTKGEPTDRMIQIIISFIILMAALYIILSRAYDADVQKWAFGIIGLIVGYWLPTK